jgi:ribose/xylose/arabinose/galactoside ABC-type transport system permease subunit
MSPEADVSTEQRTPAFDQPRVVQTSRRVLGKIGVSLRGAGVILPLVLIWVYLTATTPAFFTSYNIKNVLLEGAVVGIMAFGTTFALVTEQIDLSIGSVAGMASVVSAYVMVNQGQSWVIGVLAGIAVGLLAGVANGIASTYFGIPSFIVTLATLGIAQGISLNLTGGASIYNFPTAFTNLGTGQTFGIPNPVWIALGVLIVLQFLLKRTRLGLSFYSVGDNARAADLAGIKTLRIKTYAMIISGTCAGFAGVLLAAELNSANPEFGSAYLLNAIAAVVIGGTALTGGIGSVVDTALGVLVIVTIENGLDLKNIQPFWKEPAIGAVILLVAFLDRRRRR